MEVPGENHRSVASDWQTSSSHNVVSSTTRLSEIRSHNIGYIGSYESNYHTITTTTATLYLGTRYNQ